MAHVLRLQIVKTYPTSTTKQPRFAQPSTDLASQDARKLMGAQPAQFVLTDGLWELMANALTTQSQLMGAKPSIQLPENAPSAGIIFILWIAAV